MVLDGPAGRLRGVFRTTLHRLVPLLGLILFCAAAWVLYHQVRAHKWADVVDALRHVPVHRLLLAGALTVIGYAILSGYDYLAMRYIHHEMAFHRVAMAAFIGYAFSNSIGHSFLTGGTVRYRLYSAWGLSAGAVARIIVLSHITFYLGMLLLVGLACVLEPAPISGEARLPPASLRAIGGAMLLLAIIYFAWISGRRRPVRIRQWPFPIPTLGLSVAQLVIGALDMALVAAVLWMLLPPVSGMTFIGFLGLFMIAQVIGVGSQVPGGLGVFESLMLHVLSPEIPVPTVLAALLVYRMMYFVCPLALAAAVLGLYELRPRARPKP
jgi:uncharacterized membrane protein YbhN (UPF0104 family)